MKTVHQSVLLNEIVVGLNLENKSSPVVVDGTFGGGGHSIEILNRYPNTKIIAIDQDESALERARKNFKEYESKISFHNANFRQIAKVLEKEGIDQVDGIIFDLGFSSDQIENSLRGFSFMKDEPLIMHMKANPSREDPSAKDIVNTWSEESLADIIYGYGEERFARRIARGIVEAREKKYIETTFDLVSIIQNSVPAIYRKGRIHCATRTFQALRIAVNDELRTLSAGLSEGFEVLKSGGRMTVISFHSLEDRIVKKFYKEKQKEVKAILINKKPITATKEEIIKNNRSRSAKLRILSRL